MADHQQLTMTESESRVVKVDSIESWENCLRDASSQGAIVVVHFSAEWCAPCKFMRPAFNELSTTHSHMVFLEVNMDEQEAIARKLDVRAMPTFLFIKDEEVVDKIVGANVETLKSKIESLN